MYIYCIKCIALYNVHVQYVYTMSVVNVQCIYSVLNAYTHIYTGIL